MDNLKQEIKTIVSEVKPFDWFYLGLYTGLILARVFGL